jgi:hypothetical protein
MAERPNLQRVLADPRPERPVAGIVEAAEADMRARLQVRAQQRAAQEAARRQEFTSRPRPSQRQGPAWGFDLGRGGRRRRWTARRDRRTRTVCMG